MPAIFWRKDDQIMKKRLASLLTLVCLVAALTACGGGSSSTDGSGSQSKVEAMTEEDYQSKVDELSADISTAMSSMTGLSATDEDAFRQGIEAMRSMAAPFREFAAITNPPESWAEAHAKIAEGCNGFADSLDGLCDSAEGMLDGSVTAEDYNNAVMEYSTGLTEAATLLTEGFGMMEEAEA